MAKSVQAQKPPSAAAADICDICDQPFDVCTCDNDAFDDDGSSFDNNNSDGYYYADNGGNEDEDDGDEGLVVCKFFLEGNCKFGDSCRNIHPPPRNPNQGYFAPPPPGPSQYSSPNSQNQPPYSYYPFPGFYPPYGYIPPNYPESVVPYPRSQLQPQQTQIQTPPKLSQLELENSKPQQAQTQPKSISAAMGSWDDPVPPAKYTILKKDKPQQPSPQQPQPQQPQPQLPQQQQPQPLETQADISKLEKEIQALELDLNTKKKRDSKN